MEKPERREEVWIRRFSDGLECDVIVAIRGAKWSCRCLITAKR
jgi:hypothetical protein